MEKYLKQIDVIQELLDNLKPEEAKNSLGRLKETIIYDVALKKL